MLNPSVAAVGGYCAIIVGVLLFVTGIVFLFDPVRNSKGAKDLAEILSKNDKPRMVLFWIFAITGFFGIGAVPAIAGQVRALNEGWMDWVTILAYVGFGCMAIENFRALQINPNIILDYKAADPKVKLALSRSLSLVPLDPKGWLTYGGVGLFLFVANLIALNNGTWDTALCWIGLLCGFFYQFIVFGNLIHVYGYFKVAAGIGGIILGPLWYIWMGIHLLS